jgi:UDP-N-acetylmuramate--alanine ligase
VKLEHIQHVYLVGIGGIGMSALARYFKSRGCQVAGYDKTATDLTRKLEEEGMAVHYTDEVALIDQEMLAQKESLLVIYTPAVPQQHTELNYLRDNGYTVLKRSQVLGLLTENVFTVAIAGTHGKTTTSSMVAHVLTTAGLDVTAFLGGITQNYSSNLMLGTGSDKEVIVVEADEYDRSFLTLHPDIAIITSSDADHLDIYGERGEVTRSFNDFIAKIKKGGKLIIHKGLGLNPENGNEKQVVEYDKQQADHTIEDLQIRDGAFCFNIRGVLGNVDNIRLTVPGMHNAENALAAAGVALSMGVPPEIVSQALSSFKGVKRRFEYIVKEKGTIYIDDYAHHPAEIDAFISAVRALYPERKLTVIFQPHLFSRTRDFADEFATSLSRADEVILLPVYPARELPIEGVSSEMLHQKLTITKKRVCSSYNVIKVIENEAFDIVATLGAGDIDQLISPIKNIIKKNNTFTSSV